ncbi:MAG: Uma2 family endonuclease [Armatimonadetes bacterium]|nr:Uma2 family endonuclease [Anaerolineae bacterium]
MSALPKLKTTLAEYLAVERASDTKHELLNGEVIAMAGASENHNLIVANVIGLFFTQLLSSPCKVYASDMRVQAADSSEYYYPDVSVVCDEALIWQQVGATLLNPTVIIEVLSPSTEKRDRGHKAQQYRAMPTLQAYLLIAQDSAQVEQFTRQADGLWDRLVLTGLDSTVALASIGCTLSLSDVYRKITFDVV